jgi:hypothetical protein
MTKARREIEESMGLVIGSVSRGDRSDQYAVEIALSATPRRSQTTERGF